MIDLQEMGRAARQAARNMARASQEIKDRALEAIASGLEEQQVEIETANKNDVEAGRRNGLTEALIDRLMFHVLTYRNLFFQLCKNLELF